VRGAGGARRGRARVGPKEERKVPISEFHVTALDAAAAQKAPGVLGVLSHENAPKVPLPDDAKALVDPPTGRPLMPFQDDVVRYHGQPIAVMIAETPEQARHAASLVKATYKQGKAVTAFEDAKPFPPTEKKSGDRANKKPADYRRGEPDKGMKSAEVSVEHTYSHPDLYHNAMELHATVAAWDGQRLTLYDKTQWVKNVQKQLAAAFGLKEEDVHVVSPFVGGAFGSALRAWPHVFIAAMTARHVRRPVKLMLTRAQMSTVVGYRPHTSQKVALGATKQGKLTAIRHEVTAQTSTYEEYTENTLGPTRMMYACPNAATHYRLAALNVVTPASMRGPGEATGMYALECALDELAVALSMDPIELRLRNHADRDPQTNQPFSSKSLKECYKQGAERFGWSRRKPAPRSMSDGRQLIGWGMAGATWPTNGMKATARRWCGRRPAT
jgi:xanthine dehydrogenase YagR molybdenum-binding subunit